MMSKIKIFWLIYVVVVAAFMLMAKAGGFDDSIVGPFVLLMAVGWIGQTAYLVATGKRKELRQEREQLKLQKRIKQREKEEARLEAYREKERDPSYIAEQKELAIKSQQAAEFKAKQEERQEQKRLRTTIVRTMILDQGASKYKTKGSIVSSGTRAIVGGAIAGPVGALVGASTGKSKTVEQKSKKVRFLVEYANGKKETEEVKVDSRRYSELIQYL